MTAWLHPCCNGSDPLERVRALACGAPRGLARPRWAPASPRAVGADTLGRSCVSFSSPLSSLSLAFTLSGAPAVPSRAAGCWEVAWLPLRCCCARGGRKGGLNAGCCAWLGWGAAEEEEEADDDDDEGEG